MASDRQLNSLRSMTLKSLRKPQQGVTLLGALIFMVVGVFAMILAANLVPAYVEGYSVGKTLQSLSNESKENISSEDKIRVLLARRFGVNDVKNVKSQDITIKYQTGKVVVRVNYETRASLFANTDIVTRFDKSVEIPR